MTGRNTKGLRIKTKCATLDELVRVFSRFCDETSIFIPSATPREQGLEAPFSIDLSTGEPALVGEGVVVAAWSTADNRFGYPGMQIGVRRVTVASKTVYEKMLIARALVLDDQENWDGEDGTDVSAPPPGFDEPRVQTIPPADQPPLPAFGSKKTILGLPAIPLVKPAPSTTANAVEAASRSNGAAPRAPGFKLAIPARIAPVGGGGGGAARKPDQNKPRQPIVITTLARAPTPPPTPVAATQSLPKTPTPPTRPTPPPFAAAKAVEPAATTRPTPPPSVTTKPLEPVGRKPAQPVEPVARGSQPAVTAIPSLARGSEPPATKAAEPSAPSASPLPPTHDATSDAAPVASEESRPTRVPRAGTVLGSGPVPRAPANTPASGLANVASDTDVMPAERNAEALLVRDPAPPILASDADVDVPTPVPIEAERTERDVVNHFALAAPGVAPPIELAPRANAEPIDDEPPVAKPATTKPPQELPIAAPPSAFVAYVAPIVAKDAPRNTPPAMAAMVAPTASAIVANVATPPSAIVAHAAPIVTQMPSIALPLERPRLSDGVIQQEVHSLETMAVRWSPRRRRKATLVIGTAAAACVAAVLAYMIVDRFGARKTPPAAAPIAMTTNEVQTAPATEVAFEQPALIGSPTAPAADPIAAEPTAAEPSAPEPTKQTSVAANPVAEPTKQTPGAAKPPAEPTKRTPAAADPTKQTRVAAEPAVAAKPVEAPKRAVTKSPTTRPKRAPPAKTAKPRPKAKAKKPVCADLSCL